LEKSDDSGRKLNFASAHNEMRKARLRACSRAHISQIELTVLGTYCATEEFDVIERSVITLAATGRLNIRLQAYDNRFSRAHRERRIGFSPPPFVTRKP